MSLLSTLIIICSKSPNPKLYECINKLYKIQIGNDLNYKICVIDSDSEDLTNYELIKNDFPNVDLCFVKNKNYEYGAWKYGYSTFPNFDIYICIQDSIIIKKKIPLDVVNDEYSYTFDKYNTGYFHDPALKEEGMKFMEDSGLDYKDEINAWFPLAQHSSFIVSNSVIKDIFLTLKHPPTNKAGSCIYERNFGLYFVLKKNKKTINLYDYMDKIHGNRD